MKKPKKICNENDFRQYIHATAEDSGWHVDHIESPITAPGVVDLILSRNNLSLWIEVKIWRNGIHMLPSQKKWHRSRAAVNCLAYVICYIDGGIYVQPGDTAADLSPTDPLWKSGFRFELDRLGEMLDASEAAASGLPEPYDTTCSGTEQGENLGASVVCDPRNGTK